MYEVKPSSQFRKDLKKLAKGGYDVTAITDVIKLLASGVPMPQKYSDHALKGKWLGHESAT